MTRKYIINKLFKSALREEIKLLFLFFLKDLLKDSFKLGHAAYWLSGYSWTRQKITENRERNTLTSFETRAVQF